MNATRKQLTLALIKPDVLLASFPKQSLPSVKRSVASAFANNHNSTNAIEHNRNNPFGGIVDLIRRNEFEVLDWKTLQLSIEDAERFYGEHEGRFFYQRLVSFITSGPIVSLVLRKENAIADWRTLMGPTHKQRALREAPNSIRALYATSDTRNATHGSDSEESAAREINFFFGGKL